MLVDDKKFRVLEIFGPTIQGEGRHAGVPCSFIRFGGCDYRCRWCDSPHAVLPQLVAQAPRLTEEEIVQGVLSLDVVPTWVVFSGGNPALLHLEQLVQMFHDAEMKVMVETQGTEYKNWLLRADEVCISPKPPSSGNPTEVQTLTQFLKPFVLSFRDPSTRIYLKVVIFDQKDLEYARAMHLTFPSLEMFLSLGNEDPNLATVENPDRDPNAPLDTFWYLDRMADLMEKIAHDPDFHDVRVLPQLHVLAWGNQRGR